MLKHQLLSVNVIVFLAHFSRVLRPVMVHVIERLSGPACSSSMRHAPSMTGHRSCHCAYRHVSRHELRAAVDLARGQLVHGR